MKKLLLTLAAVMAARGAMALEEPVAVRGARALGMGDAFSAVVDDQNVFFYNPAGTVQRTGSLATLLDIPITVSDDIVELADFLDKNEEALDNLDNGSPESVALINEINGKLVALRPTFGLGAPNISYLSGPKGRWHWGWGLFGQASGRVGVNRDIILPSLFYDVRVDAVPMLNLTYSMDMPFLPGRLGLGLNAKYISRGQAKESRVSFGQLDSYDAPPLQRGDGYGADLGLLYNPVERIGLAVTMMDAGNTRLNFDARDAEDGFAAKAAFKDSIPQRVNVGVSWTPSKIGFGPVGIPLGQRLLLAADVRDVLNEESKTFFDGGVLADSAGKHIHLGAEYRFWFLRLRGGFNQGYPTVGAGLDLPVVKLDYAYFADEAGAFSGALKHDAHIVSIAIRFGTGHTESRERIAGKPVASKPAPAKTSSPEKAPATKVK